MSAPGGVCFWGLSAPGGVCSGGGVCLLGGGPAPGREVCSGGVSAP